MGDAPKGRRPSGSVRYSPRRSETPSIQDLDACSRNSHKRWGEAMPARSRNMTGGGQAVREAPDCPRYVIFGPVFRTGTAHEPNYFAALRPATAELAAAGRDLATSTRVFR